MHAASLSVSGRQPCLEKLGEDQSLTLCFAHPVRQMATPLHHLYLLRRVNLRSFRKAACAQAVVTKFKVSDEGRGDSPPAWPWEAFS